MSFADNNEERIFIFQGDSYDTPEDNRRCLMDRLLLGSRLYFYWHNINIFRKTGNAGKKGVLTGKLQTELSSGNIRLVERCGGKVHLRGLEHLRAMNGKPAVILANHMSLLETAAMHGFLRPYMDFTFVVKPALMKTPFLCNIMRALDAIVVSRDNPRQDLKTVMEEGKKRLDAGRSVVIFPQGTRSAEFNPEKFNSIGIKLAKSAGYPVIPLALKTDFLQNGKYLRDLGPVKRDEDVWFEFGPAREITGNGREDLQDIVNFIADRLNKWNAK